MNGISVGATNELPFLEIKNLQEYPNYKSELSIANYKIRFEKKFNLLSRIMFKIFFGITVKNIKK